MCVPVTTQGRQQGCLSTGESQGHTVACPLLPQWQVLPWLRVQCSHPVLGAARLHPEDPWDPAAVLWADATAPCFLSPITHSDEASQLPGLSGAHGRVDTGGLRVVWFPYWPLCLAAALRGSEHVGPWVRLCPSSPDQGLVAQGTGQLVSVSPPSGPRWVRSIPALEGGKRVG